MLSWLLEPIETVLCLSKVRRFALLSQWFSWGDSLFLASTVEKRPHQEVLSAIILIQTKSQESTCRKIAIRAIFTQKKKLTLFLSVFSWRIYWVKFFSTHWEKFKCFISHIKCINIILALHMVVKIIDYVSTVKEYMVWNEKIHF